MVQKSPHTENPQNNETLTEDLDSEYRKGPRRYGLLAGIYDKFVLCFWAYLSLKDHIHKSPVG